MTRARKVERHKYADYLRRADECASVMKSSLNEGNYNAAVINAIHCGISAADALSIFSKGERHAGQRHEDAVAFFLDIDPQSEEIQKNAKRLQRLMGVKTLAEYGEKLMTHKEAEHHVADAERLLEFVKTKAKD